MKWIAWTTAVLAAALALTAALGLAIARMLRTGGLEPSGDRAPDAHDVEVVDLTETTITLRRAARRPRNAPDAPGVWGVESIRGYDQVGAIVERRGHDIVREFLPVQHAIRAGDLVRMDAFAHPGDPHSAHGLGFEHVRISSPLGELPAWLVPGRADTWAILVHGKGANRREALRIIPVLHAAALPCLAITYRNDVDAPADPGVHYGYGRTEWEDLEAAARYALSNGAERLLIVGYSMGGAITMSFMARSALAERVAGLILDAPMLDLRTTVAHGASQLGLPVPFLAVSNRIAAARYGLKWDELDYKTSTGHLRVPILLFHGDADTIIPVSLSDAFAAANPGLVTYERVANAGHVQAWNVERERYEAAVREFIGRVAGTHPGGKTPAPKKRGRKSP
jgi:uncharacterized protein